MQKTEFDPTQGNFKRSSICTIPHHPVGNLMRHIIQRTTKHHTIQAVMEPS
jgi:hypothetical protein